jgi:outer membrane receptor for ferric coprogen and ferric-rhodotorulic acid
VSYRFNDTWSLGLYGDNLFDKTYYASVGDVFTDNVYGTPRSFVLSLRARW